MGTNIDVGGRLHSAATGNILTGANEIYDDNLNKKQDVINREILEDITDVKQTTDNIDTIMAEKIQQQLNLTLDVENNPNDIIGTNSTVPSSSAVRGSIDARTGYFECTSTGETVAKVVNNATGFVLTPGGNIRIKFSHKNTATNPTLSINGTTAKSMIYNGEAVSPTNTWNNNEVVTLYYDGTNYILENNSNNYNSSNNGTIIVTPDNIPTTFEQDKLYFVDNRNGNTEITIDTNISVNVNKTAHVYHNGTDWVVVEDDNITLDAAIDPENPSTDKAPSSKAVVDYVGKNLSKNIYGQLLGNGLSKSYRFIENQGNGTGKITSTSNTEGYKVLVEYCPKPTRYGIRLIENPHRTNARSASISYGSSYDDNKTVTYLELKAGGGDVDLVAEVPGGNYAIISFLDSNYTDIDIRKEVIDKRSVTPIPIYPAYIHKLDDDDVEEIGQLAIVDDDNGNPILDVVKFKDYQFFFFPVLIGNQYSVKLSCRGTGTGTATRTLKYGYTHSLLDYPSVGESVEDVSEVSFTGNKSMTINCLKDRYVVISCERVNGTNTNDILVEVTRNMIIEEQALVGSPVTHFTTLTEVYTDADLTPDPTQDNQNPSPITNKLPDKELTRDTFTSSNIYSLWSDLVTTYPTLMQTLEDITYQDDNTDPATTHTLKRYLMKNTRRLMTKGSYDFGTSTTNFYKKNEFAVYEKPTILLTAGMHGTEKAAMYGLYLFAKLLLSSTDEWAMFIKSNFDIEFVPLINAANSDAGIYGDITGTYGINRDFATFTYPSTNMINKLFSLDAHKIIMHIDLHNQGNNIGGFINNENNKHRGGGKKCFISSGIGQAGFGDCIRFADMFTMFADSKWLADGGYYKLGNIEGSADVASPNRYQSEIAPLFIVSQINDKEYEYGNSLTSFTRRFGIVSATVETPLNLFINGSTGAVANKNSSSLVVDILINLINSIAVKYRGYRR